MYKSFDDLVDDCQSQTADTDSTTETYFKSKLNEGIQKGYAALPSEYFFTSSTDLTEASTTSYPMPYNCEKLHTISVAIASTNYVVLEFPGNENQWISLIGTGTPTASDYPLYFFPKTDTYEVYPQSSTASYVITLRYIDRGKNLTNADYTTDTIKTATSGSTAIVGNATVWTSAMEGRFFQLTDDDRWYKIASVTDNTNLVLSREFVGTSVSAGTASYKIGEMSLLPKSQQSLPVSYALWKYYGKKTNDPRAKSYKAEFDEGLEELKSYAGNLTTSGVIDEDIVIRNINDWPLDLS